MIDTLGQIRLEKFSNMNNGTLGGKCFFSKQDFRKGYCISNQLILAFEKKILTTIYINLFQLLNASVTNIQSLKSRYLCHEFSVCNAGILEQSTALYYNYSKQVDISIGCMILPPQGSSHPLRSKIVFVLLQLTAATKKIVAKVEYVFER